MDYFLALQVNVKFVQQLADSLLAFVTPNWNIKTVNYVQKILKNVLYLEQQCNAIDLSLVSDDMQDTTLRIFFHDIHNPIAVIRGYCALLQHVLKHDDAVCLHLAVIDYYMDDMRIIIEDYRKSVMNELP